MPLVLKDILLVIMLIFVMMMLATVFINLFLVKVPYVPTSRKALNEILKHVKVNPQSKVHDLGCGDGRFLFAMESQFKTECFGYELAPIPFLLSKLTQYFRRSKVNFYMKNFLKVNLSNADLIFCYLSPDLLTKLGDKLQKECKQGTQIITNTFKISNLEPVKVLARNRELKHPSIYIYEI